MYTPILLIAIFSLIPLLSKISAFRIVLTNKNHLLFGIFSLKTSIFLVSCHLWGYSFDLYSYFEHAELIFKGDIPTKDFLSPYSIGFEYLVAALVSILNSPISLGIGFLLLEVFSYWLLSKQITIDNESILYFAFNPIVFHFTTFDIQDEIVMMFFITLLLIVLNKKKYSIVIVSFLTFFFTKILSILLLVGVFLKDKIQGVFFFISLGFFYLILLKLNFQVLSLEFSRSESKDVLNNIISSGNVYWLLSKYNIRFPDKLPILSTLIALGGFNLFIFFKKINNKIEIFLICGIINLLIFLTLYKMTLPYYYLIVLYLLFIYDSVHNKKQFKQFSFFTFFCFIISINHQINFLITTKQLTNQYLLYIFDAIQITIIIFNISLFYQYIVLLIGKNRISYY